MKRIQGELKLDGVNYYFFSEITGRIKNTVGYVKYINKIDTNPVFTPFDWSSFTNAKAPGM